MQWFFRAFPHFIHCYRTLSVIAAVVFFCPLLFADTTWVAGDVYGVWDTTGSPFMVTDTITVPLDSTLEIRPGVEIWFLDQEIRRTPIYVYGRLLAVGEESDSIYFFSPGAGFSGISNGYIYGTEIRFEYCVIDSMRYRILSWNGHTTILHSRIHGAATILDCMDENDTLQYNNFHSQWGGGGWIYYYTGNLVFQHNRGLNIVLRVVGGQTAPVFDNHLLSLDFTSGSVAEVFDNETSYMYITATNTHLHHNQITGRLYITNASPVVEHNYIGGGINATWAQSIIRENTIYFQVDLNSCSSNLYKNLVISPWGPSSAIALTGYGTNLIQSNTIIFHRYGISSSAASITNLAINNIFVGDEVNSTGVYCLNDSLTIRYNDFHRVNTVVNGCELDTGNIFLDPQFRGGYPFDYGLQANSPCIDAGDPALPMDPDSTRSDMGAYYYDQLIDQPPALVSPPEVNAQLGRLLRYVARATDDNGPLQFGFWDLPPWLNIETGLGLDWVADSAAISGTVPLEQENFSFGVWVEDGLAQRDSQEVTVLVSHYTILAGNLTGVLTVAESPYLAVEDLIVPQGDSLRIEPGVEIRFKWYNHPDLQLRMVVWGSLSAMGTEDDTIRFLPEFEDSLGAWRGIWCVGLPEDTINVEYAYFSNAQYCVVADSLRRIKVRHCRFVDSYKGIAVYNNSWAVVDSCQFHVYNTHLYLSNMFVYVLSSSANVTNCYSEFPSEYNYGSHIAFSGGSQGFVQGCTFIGGRDGHFEYSSYGVFIGNVIMNTYNKIIFANGSSGIVANNIYSGSGLILAAADSVLVTNNLFYHNNQAVQISLILEEIDVKNNIFLANDLALKAQYTAEPFTNFSYNDFYENVTNFDNCTPDSTNIYLDPMVQDTVDFHLQLGSPCINAGDPDPFFNDPDSTRNDIGCWGGPWGESYPYSPVLSQLSKPMPTEFALLPPYPNPFNSVLVIPFTIPTQSEVKITIYNILGQRVDQFDFSPVSPGVHRKFWDASSLASGIYIVRLMAGDREFNQKVVLLR